MSGGSVEPTAGANINRRGSVAEIGSHSATSGDVTRSGGIPSFVQERIDERVRRRSELDLLRGPDHEVSKLQYCCIANFMYAYNYIKRYKFS